MIKNSRVVIVTGIAGSIGTAIYEKFVSNKDIVIGVDNNQTGLDELKNNNKAFNEGLHLFNLDIRDKEKVDSFIKIIESDFGKIDVLINNAGGNTTTLMSTTSDKEWNEDIDLNLSSAYYLCDAVIPGMILNNGGSIVNIGSVNGLSIFNNPGYSAAKAGLISLTKFISVEYGCKNIRSNIVCPGTVRTKAWDEYIEKYPDFFNDVKAIYPSNRICTPEDIAGPVYFLCSEDAKGLNGSNIVVDGGLTSGNPSVLDLFTK